MQQRRISGVRPCSAGRAGPVHPGPQRVRAARDGLGAAGEQDVATRIVALEAELAAGLAGVRAPAHRADGRRGGTRAAGVDLLGDAIRALGEVRGGEADRLRALWSDSERLRWELALSAVRVVYGEARRLRSWEGVSEADLVQEGLIGLLGAAKRYEPGRDIRFATYARWWVRAHMTQAIGQSRVVRLAASATEQLRKLRKAILGRERKGEWSMAQVAGDVGIGLQRARELLAITTTESLEASDAGFLLADEREGSPEDQAIDRERADRLRQVMRRVLSGRELQIMALRYGIDEEPRSIVEIATTLSLSGERVRQIERACLENLRQPSAWAPYAPRAAAI